jgi:hypothetical protein
MEDPKRGYSDHRGGAVMKVKGIYFSSLVLLLLGAGVALNEAGDQQVSRPGFRVQREQSSKR